jgi:hypothetical protein
VAEAGTRIQLPVRLQTDRSRTAGCPMLVAVAIATSQHRAGQVMTVTVDIT